MKTLDHQFVEIIPDNINEGILYISLKYCTIIHKCACGCGNEVVTPISPTGWSILFNGKAISIYPSIGNFNLACESHYWITNGVVKHVRKWSKGSKVFRHKEKSKKS